MTNALHHARPHVSVQRRALYLLLCIGWGLLGFGPPSATSLHAETPSAPPVTIITVDTSTDLDPTSNNKTCTYTQGTLFFPGGDGCTLRRAILEASARPQVDRPIEIRFNLPANDPNRNLEVTGTWTLPLAGALPPLKTPSIADKNGQVTIDGDTQPGGRAGGPKIIIATNDTSLEIESERNIIRNLSFKNGGAIFVKEDDNIIEQIWMGLNDAGTAIAFRTPGDEFRMAHGGIRIVNANNNIIRNNVLSGAFARAVDIDRGNNNVVEGNLIGTRADGTVPVVAEASRCVRSLNFDPQNWYGGWGIALSGSNHTIMDNRIAGLHIVQSANDSAPLAIEIFGSGHTIQDNIIGVDSAGAEVGVCGYGIKVSGKGTNIVGNTVVRSGVSFENSIPTAIFASDSSPTFGQITVRGNLVKDGPGDVYNFGTGIPQALRTFVAAQVTTITGMTVTGSNGAGSPCPNCLIDLYLDDTNTLTETLTYLGSTTANAAGNFTFTMGAALPAGRGLRTASTTQAANIIGNLGAGTSTKVSRLYLPPAGVTIQAPPAGQVNLSYPITVTVNPLGATPPFDYRIDATGHTSRTLNGSNSPLVTTTYIWNSPGVKSITATVTSGLGTVTASRRITITAAPVQPLYLPSLSR